MTGALTVPTTIIQGLSAQWVASGGGTISYLTNATAGYNLLWSTRFILIPISKQSGYGGADGYININCPTSGTITYYTSTTTTVSCSAQGINIPADWVALYYRVTPGQASGSDATRFALVQYYGGTQWTPSSDWILIGTTNQDNGNSYFKCVPAQCNIPLGQSYNASYASPSSLGVGLLSPSAPFHVYQGNGGNPATTGSSDVNVAHRIQGGSVFLDTGVYGNGSFWIQPRLCTNFATNYSVILCPNGGGVGIGVAAPSYKLHVNADIFADGGWVRVSGTSGFYFQDYGGGWNMTDTTYIRAYGSKSVYTPASLYCDTSFIMGGTAVIDSSRNLINIAAITSSGAHTSAGVINANGGVMISDSSSVAGSRPAAGYWLYTDKNFGIELQNQEASWNVAFVTRAADGGFEWKLSDGTEVAYLSKTGRFSILGVSGGFQMQDLTSVSGSRPLQSLAFKFDNSHAVELQQNYATWTTTFITASATNGGFAWKSDAGTIFAIWLTTYFLFQIPTILIKPPLNTLTAKISLSTPITNPLGPGQLTLTTDVQHNASFNWNTNQSSWRTQALTIQMGGAVSAAFLNSGSGVADRFIVYNTLGNLTVYGYYNGGWGSTSDRRVKKNIEPLDEEKSVAFVKKLSPCSFEWNDVNGMPGVNAGFIAQEVLESAGDYAPLRSMVDNCDLDGDPMLGLTPSKMIPSLVMTIQQLLKRVEALEARLNNSGTTI